jgi:two-component system, LytTR family, sensor kinase
LLGSIGFAFLFSASLLSYKLYTDRELRKAQQQRTIVQLKLKSIRSQLNPHFLFNALSSIQNLINKNHMAEANRYLSKFAGLTRNVLQSSDSEMTSLDEEMKIAEDYLQMEQLRFKFCYECVIANGLDKANIEVPSMLLQPILENAVKHGVSALRENGRIKVSAYSVGKHLEYSVADNGSGFDNDINDRGKSSYGLRLTEERVRLHNEAYKNQPAVMDIRSTPDGTVIKITLYNWM